MTLKFIRIKAGFYCTLDERFRVVKNGKTWAVTDDDLCKVVEGFRTLADARASLQKFYHDKAVANIQGNTPPVAETVIEEVRDSQEEKRAVTGKVKAVSSKKLAECVLRLKKEDRRWFNNVFLKRLDAVSVSGKLVTGAASAIKAMKLICETFEVAGAKSIAALYGF